LIRAQNARQTPAGRAPCRQLVEAQPRGSRKRASIGH
jgi:hypothetical protein